MNAAVADYSLQPLNFHEAWSAGHVIRFHANRVQRKQTVGEHSFGVALLCMILWPEKPMLVQKAILHDVPEVVMGDTPHPAKRLLGLDPLKEADLEAGLLANFADFGPYSDEDELRLKIADMLDFVLYVQYEMSMGNNHAAIMYHKGSELACRRVNSLPEEEAHRVGKLMFDILQQGNNLQGRYA